MCNYIYIYIHIYIYMYLDGESVKLSGEGSKPILNTIVGGDELPCSYARSPRRDAARTRRRRHLVKMAIEIVDLPIRNGDFP